MYDGLPYTLFRRQNGSEPGSIDTGSVQVFGTQIRPDKSLGLDNIPPRSVSDNDYLCK